MFVASLGYGLLVPILPQLVTDMRGGDFASGSRMYGAIIGSFALMQFLAGPVLGALSDRYGRRLVLLVSLAGSAIDYCVMALAPSVGWLFVGRAISGLTSAMLVAANAYIADVTPANERARSFGAIGATLGLGFVVGPLIGGLLGSIHPRLPFWSAAMAAALNWLYGFLLLPESLPAKHRSAFEWRKANPIGVFAHVRQTPWLLRLSGAYLLLALSQTIVMSTWVLYTAFRFGWSTRDVGISLGLSGVASALVQVILLRPMIGWWGDRRTALVGFSVTTLALVAYGLATRGWMIYTIIPFAAVGAIAAPAMQSLVTQHVSASEQGRVQGLFSSITAAGAIVGPLLGTWTFAWMTRHVAAEAWRGISFFAGATLVLAAAFLAAGTLHRLEVSRLAPATTVS
jgi:MFS transporter, DHA1 family, tetracycline resistance protein